MNTKEFHGLSKSLLTACGYGVHIYTSLGALFAVFALVAIHRDDYRTAFFYLTVAMGIDTTDGTLARRVDVATNASRIDGKKLDSLVDFLNVTFVPLLLVGRARWFPSPVWLWVAVALVASLFNYSLVKTQAHRGGYLLGFPAFYNVIAFYIAVLFRHAGPHVVLGIVLVVAVLELMPIRFVNPNQARRHRAWFIMGGYAWLAAILYMIILYPSVPLWMAGASLIFPAAYFTVSLWIVYSD